MHLGWTAEEEEARALAQEGGMGERQDEPPSNPHPTLIETAHKKALSSH